MSLLITDLYREPKHLKALAKEKGINSDLELVSIFGGNTLSLPNKKDVINYYFQKDFNFQSCPAVIKMSLFNMMHFQDQESYTLLIHAIKNKDFAKNLLVQTSHDLAFKKRLCMIFFCTKGPHELAFVKTLRNHTDLITEHISFAKYLLNPNSLMEKVQNTFFMPSNTLNIKKILSNIIPCTNHPDFNNRYIRPLKIDIINYKKLMRLTQAQYDDLFEWNKTIPSLWGQEQLNKILIELPRQTPEKQDAIIRYLKSKWRNGLNFKDYSKLTDEAILTYKELIGAYTYRLVSTIMKELIELVPDVDSVKSAFKANLYSDKQRYNNRLEFWKKYTKQCTNMSFHLPIEKVQKLPNIKDKFEIKISNQIPDALVLKFKNFIVVQPLGLNEKMRWWALKIFLFPTPNPYAEKLLKKPSFFPDDLEEIQSNAPIVIKMVRYWQIYLANFLKEELKTEADFKEILKALPSDTLEKDAVITDKRSKIVDIQESFYIRNIKENTHDGLLEEDEGVPIFVIAKNTEKTPRQVIDILKKNSWDVDSELDCISSEDKLIAYDIIRKFK